MAKVVGKPPKVPKKTAGSSGMKTLDIPVDFQPKKESIVSPKSPKNTSLSLREFSDKFAEETANQMLAMPTKPEPRFGRPPKDPGKYTVIGNPPRSGRNVAGLMIPRVLDRNLKEPRPSDISPPRLLDRKTEDQSEIVQALETIESASEETLHRSSSASSRRRALQGIGGLGSVSMSSLPETETEQSRTQLSSRRRSLLGPVGSGSLQSLPAGLKPRRASDVKQRPKTAGSTTSSRRSSLVNEDRLNSTISLTSTTTPSSALKRPLSSRGTGSSHVSFLPQITPGGGGAADADLITYRVKKPGHHEPLQSGSCYIGSTTSSSSRSSLSSRPSISISINTLSTVSEDASLEKDHPGGGRKKVAERPKSPDSVHSWLSWPQTYKKRPKTPNKENTKKGKRFTSAQPKNKGTFLKRRSIVIVTEEEYWRRLKIEEKISIDTLESLKTAFHTADVDGTGKLELDEFKTLLKNHLNLATSKEGQIDLLFQKIDWSSEGAITWDEFCTYMQLEYAEKEDSYLRAKEVAFGLPAKIENMPHREPVLRITDTSDGVFIACSQDGLVTFWSGNLDHKRTRSVVTAEQSSRTKPKWITDFCLMPQYNKLIVGTGDREIQFFELSSFEPYCQISGLETVPLKLDYCSTGHDECLILFGDSQGCVNILVIGSAGECLRMWKKAPKAEGIASVSIDVIAKGSSTEFIRWKVHGDWVQQLKYYHNIRQVISCSNHSNTALVIGCTMGSTHVEQQLKEIKDPGQQTTTNKSKQSYQFGQPKTRLAADQSVFKVYKGVKCFDFSKHKNIIITGGMDRIVRLWNPYVPLKPTGMLRGHSAPIFYLFIAEEENRIFSISTDLCIKIWDIQDQNCLLTVRPKGHKIRGDLQACHYSNVSKALAIATDQMNGLSLKMKPALHADIVITHKDPIHTCVYNPSFKQIITASDGSVIKIWDFETGAPIFEYGEAHGEHAVTCTMFDNTGRRLITGGRDGCIRIWNYNNGHCLKTMMKEKDNEEICDLCYVEMNKNRYVVAVGWDKRVNIYSDATDGGVHHIQHPLAKWADDVNNGHKEDILSVAQCPPNLLATSGYDGEVIVWNMVSGHIFCHLNAPSPQGYTDQSSLNKEEGYESPPPLFPTVDGDLSINKLVFLKTRACSKEAGTLIASGPRGHIHFWNVFSGGALLAQFPGSRMPGAMVTALAVVDGDQKLFSADNLGFIYLWNIDGYCLEGDEAESPELVLTWRAHVESVTCITLVHETKTILTASTDCTVRVWSFDGEYVGTFGQQDTWDIYNSGTYQHPMVPYDVLIDPMSLPDHPVLQDKQNVHQVVHEDSARNSDDEEKVERWTPTQYGKNTVYVGDEEIAEEVKKLAPTLRGKDMKNKGKRLRHEQKRPIKIDRGGPSEYRMLTCYSLDPTPALAEPKFKGDKDTQFDFFPTL